MRDAERLNKFYDRLKELHKKYCPDWRFGQLMVNLANEMGDPFYWEEGKFLEILEEYMKRTFVLTEAGKKMADAIEIVNKACADFNDCDDCPIHRFFEDAEEDCCIPDIQIYLNGINRGVE